ncbi:MAG: 16S rRNA (adenine(1518)-N(6)/adenine(1519)-N(6))-dimethyltransferase RsmA [Chloroflexota bacterium]
MTGSGPTNKTGGRPDPASSLFAQARRLLRQHQLHARKGLAQHFLIDAGVLQRILTASELTSSDVVVEVGPGLGVLTRELAQRAGWVVAVELDDQLAAILKNTLAAYKNLTIVNGDILKIDPVTLLDAPKAKLTTRVNGYKVVANLPYYITSPVLRHFLEASVKPSVMVLMVQKEVAEQIVAPPGRMSLLSVGVQLYGQPAIVSQVPARSFYPVPEVDSAILKVTVHPQPIIKAADAESFFRVVRAGFSAARKQIVNPLSHGLNLPKADVLSRLEKTGIDPHRRAETLSLEEWAKLWGVFTEEKNEHTDSTGTG